MAFGESRAKGSWQETERHKTGGLETAMTNLFSLSSSPSYPRKPMCRRLLPRQGSNDENQRCITA